MKGANRPTPSLVVPDSWPEEGGEGGIDGGRDGGANMCLRFDSISYLMFVAEILSVRRPPSLPPIPKQMSRRIRVALSHRIQGINVFSQS